MAVSLVVEFGQGVDEDSALAVAELDGTRNVDSEGNERSQFLPGDEVYFLVHHDNSVYIDRVTPTDGMVVAMDSDTQEREQQLLFVNDEQQQLTYLPGGALVHDWMPGGANRDVGFTRVNRQVSVAASSAPCIENLTYPVNFQLYRLIPPALNLSSGETYSIAVVIYMEAVT